MEGHTTDVQQKRARCLSISKLVFMYRKYVEIYNQLSLNYQLL